MKQKWFTSRKIYEYNKKEINKFIFDYIPHKMKIIYILILKDFLYDM